MSLFIDNNTLAHNVWHLHRNVECFNVLDYVDEDLNIQIDKFISSQFKNDIFSDSDMSRELCHLSVWRK